MRRVRLSPTGFKQKHLRFNTFENTWMFDFHFPQNLVVRSTRSLTARAALMLGYCTKETIWNSSFTSPPLVMKSPKHARTHLLEASAHGNGHANVVICQGPAKADSTLWSSQAVPHPSTNRALCRLTSEVRRDPVHSTRYGRQRILFGSRLVS